MEKLTRTEIESEINKYLEQKFEEQKMKILLETSLEVENIQLVSLSVHVVSGIHHAADDVFVIKHRFMVTIPGGCFFQTMYSFIHEDLEEDNFVPENEGEIEFFSRDGSKYPSLEKMEHRHRTNEEECIISVLGTLEYLDVFQNEQEYHLIILEDFKRKKTEELNESALKYFPFVSSFEYSSGSYVRMHLENGTKFFIRSHEFDYQLHEAKKFVEVQSKKDKQKESL